MRDQNIYLEKLSVEEVSYDYQNMNIYRHIGSDIVN